MRKILILFTFILFVIGINSGYFHELQQKQSSLFKTIEQEDNKDFSVENNSQFFFEASHIIPVACEKPSFSLRLHSAFRLLIFTISFKEVCIKQFFKNRLLISETISNICLVKQLHAGYYTYGLGKIRF
jgi:hypothetical protein